MTDVLCELGIMTASTVNVTVYLVLHMGPMPTRFSWNSGITYPVLGKSAGRFGMARLHVASDVCGMPAAVPTYILEVVPSILDFGATGIRKMLLTP